MLSGVELLPVSPERSGRCEFEPAGPPRGRIPPGNPGVPTLISWEEMPWSGPPTRLLEGQLHRFRILALYASERWGNFSYAVPVAEGRYRVNLKFCEAHYGLHNTGIGGLGSRVFDVYCNGVALLQEFRYFQGGGRRWTARGPNLRRHPSERPRQNRAHIRSGQRDGQCEWHRSRRGFEIRRKPTPA